MTPKGLEVMDKDCEVTTPYLHQHDVVSGGLKEGVTIVMLILVKGL